MKKTASWVLILAVMLPSMMIGCQDDAIMETEATVEKEIESVVVETDLYDPGLPDRKFDGADFTVLHYDETYQRHFFTVNPDNTSEVIGAASDIRNKQVQETYDVVICETASGDLLTELTGAVLSGDGQYDMVLPHSSTSYAAMITSDLVRDMSAVEYLDLSRDWWYPKALEHMEIADKIYFASGYYTVTCQNFFGLLYNKDLHKDLGIESPTNLALDGEWTLDEMQNMMETATTDLDGNGVMINNDRYGFVTCTNIMYPFMSGFGEASVGKSAEGKPVLQIYNERTVDIVDRMNTLMKTENVYFGIYQEQAYLRDNFNSGRALFSMLGIGAYYGVMRELEPDFGILPLPKYTSEQESYYTLRADAFLGIPTVVNDIEKTGIVLEALTASSMEYVYPAFKEEVLYAKCLRDEASAKVLDLFYDSTIYDIGMTYCSDRTFARLLDQYGSTKEINFASLYASKEASITEHLDSLYSYITGGN